MTCCYPPPVAADGASSLQSFTAPLPVWERGVWYRGHRVRQAIARDHLNFPLGNNEDTEPSRC